MPERTGCVWCYRWFFLFQECRLLWGIVGKIVFQLLLLLIDKINVSIQIRATHWIDGESRKLLKKTEMKMRYSPFNFVFFDAFSLLLLSLWCLRFKWKRATISDCKKFLSNRLNEWASFPWLWLRYDMVVIESVYATYKININGILRKVQCYRFQQKKCGTSSFSSACIVQKVLLSTTHEICATNKNRSLNLWSSILRAYFHCFCCCLYWNWHIHSATSTWL